MIRGFSLAISAALMTGVVSMANAASKFDPFKPSASSNTAAIAAATTVVPASSSIAVPSGVKPATTSTGGTIFISVNNAPQVQEFPNKSTVQYFTFTLNKPSTGVVKFHYETADGTAKFGKDYTWASGWLQFAPGQTSITVKVTILPSLPANPRFISYLMLLYTDPTSHGPRPDPVYGATIARGTATGVIDTGVATH